MYQPRGPVSRFRMYVQMYSSIQYTLQDILPAVTKAARYEYDMICTFTLELLSPSAGTKKERNEFENLDRSVVKPSSVAAAAQQA